MGGGGVGVEGGGGRRRGRGEIRGGAGGGGGGEVVGHGARCDEAKAKAIEVAQRQGFAWVPPCDHPVGIAGQGTLALELREQDWHLDRVLGPVGG
ncbi:hypothetical protein CE497_25650, partial [Salmonella enterica subsp. enterica serovar Typhimurium]